MKDTDLKVLETYEFLKKKRYGNRNDGGYVVAELDCKYDCFISAGVGGGDEFSIEFLNANAIDKCNCFAFDGTISDYPHSSNLINFISKNVGLNDTDKETTLNDIIKTHNSVFIKMDIEGSEYKWIESVDMADLTKISQLVIECHALNDDTWGANYEQKVNCLRKLSSTHYLVHAHANNYGGFQDNIPDFMEFTYVSKRLFDSPLPLNSLNLPSSSFDFPNKDGHRDYDLNFYPFVSVKINK